MIGFTCGQCGQSSRVADTLAGKTGSCKQCGSPIRIPEIETSFPMLDLDEEDSPYGAGSPAKVGTKYCQHCGRAMAKLAEICLGCGVRQPQAAAAKGRSKLVAALFAFFLGGLGIHKFYLGRIGWGMLYLLFFWTFIPAIIALVDGIILLTMSEDAFAEKYGSA